MSTSTGDMPPEDRRDSPPATWVRVLRAIIALLLIGAGVLLWAHERGAAEDGTSASPAPATVKITKGAIVDQTVVRGVLHYSPAVPILAWSEGVLTALPDPGVTIRLGETLYRVDDRPVVLLNGELPTYRELAAGMSPGVDVRQLERSLSKLGFFAGMPDATFTSDTAAAIARLQSSIGAEPTGALGRGSVVFAPGPVRVDVWAKQLGAPVGPGTQIYTTTHTAKVVDVDMPLGSQALASTGVPVEVNLPDGSSIRASVTSVGQAVERDGAGSDSGGGTAVVPVTVGLRRQADASAFERADVTASFSSTLARDALTVPVEALLAVDASSFGVEVFDFSDASTMIVPVKLGPLAAGRVEIEGSGIAAGTPVVVPGS